MTTPQPPPHPNQSSHPQPGEPGHLSRAGTHGPSISTPDSGIFNGMAREVARAGERKPRTPDEVVVSIGPVADGAGAPAHPIDLRAAGSETEALALVPESYAIEHKVV